jgi:amino acid adenylation domain-containing protein
MQEHTENVESNSHLSYAEDALLARQLEEPIGHVHGSGAASVSTNPVPTAFHVFTHEMPLSVMLRPEQLEAIVQSVPGGAGNIEDIHPLAPLQEAVLSDVLLSEHGSDPYVVPTLLSLPSRSHLPALVAAMQAVIDRHEALRSAVFWRGLQQPVHVVYRRASLPVEELLLDPKRNFMEELNERMIAGTATLDLEHAPLMKLQATKDIEGAGCFVLFQIHHLITDHESWRTVLKEAMVCLEGREAELPPPVPYRKYVMQALEHASEANEFFRRTFGDSIEPTVPFMAFKHHARVGRLEEARLAMEPERAMQIRSVARRCGVSAARLFHAAWGLVVAHTSGRDDVVFGTIMKTMRYQAGRGQCIGMFVNTLPLRLRFAATTAAGLVEQTHRELTELSSHKHAPLKLSQRCSGVPAGTPLFTALFNYRRSEPDTYATEVGAGGVRLHARAEAMTTYPIEMSVDDLGDGFNLLARSDGRIDPRRMLDYLSTGMHSLLDALTNAPDTPAMSLQIMSEPERYRIIESFNATQAPYPKHQLIHQLFEAQVGRTPDAIAVVYADEYLTYDQLNSKADRLANYLRRRCVGPGCFVGLCVERGLEALVGILGILKSGGAYVPLDPSYPTERLNYMLKDSAPKVVLTQEHLKARLQAGAPVVVALDAEWEEIASESRTDSEPTMGESNSANLAYVIYTSGSTGLPKGVMIEHRHVINLWYGLERLYGQGAERRRLALNASLNFDASVQQFVQLLSGHALFVIPEEVRRDASSLLKFLDKNQIDGIDCTPSQLKTWISTGLLGDKRRPLRTVLVGGEAIDGELWSTLARAREMDFYNVYGPTECTVDSTAAYLNSDPTLPHIGHPMVNRCVYILDRYKQPAPLDVAGEIYIGGDGVGRGYLNRPELTAERFVKDPFASDPEARMYKTGDVGRWRADGTIEYLGRNDHQVKVRGFRIELGEIEARLLECPEVKETVVIAREDVPGEIRLVAYVVARDASRAPNSEELRVNLKQALPEHMVPSAFVLIEKMPLTPNGKLDRRALRAPDLAAYANRQYEPPQGEVEEILASIWQSLLGTDSAGRDDNFFELGGHSLLAVQLIARVAATLSVEMPIRLLFDFPTVRELAAQLEGLRCTRLADRIAEGGTETEDLLEEVASLSESRVHELLGELKSEFKA